MSVEEFFDTALNLGMLWYPIVIALCGYIAGLITATALSRVSKVTVYEIEVE